MTKFEVQYQIRLPCNFKTTLCRATNVLLLSIKFEKRYRIRTVRNIFLYSICITMYCLFILLSQTKTRFLYSATQFSHHISKKKKRKKRPGLIQVIPPDTCWHLHTHACTHTWRTTLHRTPWYTNGLFINPRQRERENGEEKDCVREPIGFIACEIQGNDT